jgi:hypothetical protein
MPLAPGTRLGPYEVVALGPDASESNDIVVALDWAQGLKPK